MSKVPASSIPIISVWICIGDRQIVARHRLLRQLALEGVELVQARRECGHYMPAWARPLLPIDVVAQCVIEHGLELTPLGLGDLAQRRQYLRGGLRGEFLAGGRSHADHDES